MIPFSCLVAMSDLSVQVPLASDLPGFQLTELLYSGPKAMVYRATMQEGGQQVVLKLLRHQSQGLPELVQLQNEYAIAKSLSCPGVIKALDLRQIGNSYALIFEDCGSISLQHYRAQNTLSIIDVLRIGYDLASILQELSQHRVIHKDIKPSNILIHPESQQIKLIDFSIASRLPKEKQDIRSPHALEGSLAYIAPEQTGRINRSIDYRADFYALGVTLYELFCGHLPFTETDPMALLHCHIAKLATPIDQVRSDVPAPIAAIVEKLMAKNAEDRYQSAQGLKYDLEWCLKALQQTGAIAEFRLGERDICDRFIIPEKLYGRQSEVQMLLESFNRITMGTTEFVMVSGPSGIGKTAVISEVHQPIALKNGYFIQGKFDQFNRQIPFHAFIQAFQDLARQLLSESDDELNSWKDHLLKALGRNIQVIIDLIPEIGLIVGPQSTVPKLTGAAAQTRFNMLFLAFMEGSAISVPLMIFKTALSSISGSGSHYRSIACQ